MDRCLILKLVHQANEGYKVDKGFKDHTYTAALSGKDINTNLSRQMDVSDNEYTLVFDHNENTAVNDLGDIEGNGSRHQQDNDSSQIPTQGKRNHGSSNPMRCHSKKPKNAEIVVEIINAVANNMARLDDAYEMSKPCVNYSDLYKDVMDVEALDIDS
ncbi:unnamed protein product [Ilex paraguariensis]|uniref:Uncharacterized protein n=1 Tax=Ilex paraguariensis TaxID=185542 RepID=A0ABC8R0J5_9AQUA